MQKFSDIKIDISNMTTEELQKAKKEILKLLSTVDHQLLLRKMAENRFKS